jgi:hypothetical protein
MKIRERKASRVGPGGAASGLMLIAGVLAPLLWSESNRLWFNQQVRSVGIGWFGGYAWLVPAGVALLCGIAAAILADRHKRRLQPLRDSEVSLEGPHALYLRPYFTDTGTPLLNPFYSAWSGGLSLEAYALNPEQFVGRVLEPYINVREVGGNPSTVANSRILIPYDAWQDAVKEAIHAAAVIVMMPLMLPDRNTGIMRGEATIWELQYIVESGLLDRTIVLMPHVPWGARKRTRGAWERTRNRVAEFGLELPAYREQGDVLVFSHADEAWRMEKLFSPALPARKQVAAGLVEALRWTSERCGFALLDR